MRVARGVNCAALRLDNRYTHTHTHTRARARAPPATGTARYIAHAPLGTRVPASGLASHRPSARRPLVCARAHAARPPTTPAGCWAGALQRTARSAGGRGADRRGAACNPWRVARGAPPLRRPAARRWRGRAAAAAAFAWGKGSGCAAARERRGSGGSTRRPRSRPRSERSSRDLSDLARARRDLSDLAAICGDLARARRDLSDLAAI